MFERFTAAARLVVEDAASTARRDGTGEITPAHLLGALIADDASPAVAVLTGVTGLPATTWRDTLAELRGRWAAGFDGEDAEALAGLGIDLADVVRRLGEGEGPGPRRGRIRLSRASRTALGAALREAVALGDGAIGSVHLLLGVLAVDDRTVGNTLAVCGADPAAVRRAVAAMGRRAG